MEARADHVLLTFVAGGISTCCAKTSTAPLERLKILFQAQNRHYKDMGVLRALRVIYQKEGALGYYRGNGALMLRVFPYGAVQFVSYEQYKKAIGPMCDNCSVSKLFAGSLADYLSFSPQCDCLSNKPQVSMVYRLINHVGCWKNKRRICKLRAAGITACSFTYPLDVVRSRLAFQVADEKIYCGVCHVIRQIVTTEGGFTALYRGYGATALAMIPAVGFGFFAYESIKDFILAMNGALTKVNQEDQAVLTPLGGLVCGAFAGASSQTVAYPLDVVRRRMQLAGAVSDGYKYSGCINTFVTVYMEDGVRKGLYRGLSINYLRVVPQVAVMFSVYELTKQFLSQELTSPRSE